MRGVQILQDLGVSDLFGTKNLDDVGETEKLMSLRTTKNYSVFDGISDNKIEAMTLQEFERHQDERMK